MFLWGFGDGERRKVSVCLEIVFVIVRRIGMPEFVWLTEENNIIDKMQRKIQNTSK